MVLEVRLRGGASASSTGAEGKSLSFPWDEEGEVGSTLTTWAVIVTVLDLDTH